MALKLRPAGAADKIENLHWAFRRRRRPRADSFKRWLGCTDHNGLNMIRKLASGRYRLYSLKKNPKTGKRRNLGIRAEIETMWRKLGGVRSITAHSAAVRFRRPHLP